MSYSYLVVSDFIYCSIFRFELVFFYTGFEDRVIRNLKKVDNNCGRYGTKCLMWFYYCKKDIVNLITEMH